VIGRRNVLLLAFSQAATLSAMVMSMALGAILGSTLAPDRGLATLPIAVMVIGTAIASLPAAMLMRRHGRRAGFLVGAALGVSGSLLAALALHRGSFALFVAGHLLLGSFQGFANYYRFAAVESTDTAHTSRAIAWVVAGGVVAAFLGPQVGEWGRDWFGNEPFVGSYLAQGVLGVAALLLLSQLHLAPQAVVARGAARPLQEIVAQPALRASILGTAVGYAVMVMAMTATPLAMLGCGLPGTSVTPVIQWHVVAMFAPSLVTGALIKRHGAPRVMQIGFLLLLGHVAITVLGVAFLHFLSALILLGVGWNFSFIAGTALLTRCYRPAEQTRVQAVNEFTVFGLVAIASLAAGWLYDRFGWTALNLAALPLLIAALVATSTLGQQPQQLEQPA
jgi:MFS family permease